MHSIGIVFGAIGLVILVGMALVAMLVLIMFSIFFVFALLFWLIEFACFLCGWTTYPPFWKTIYTMVMVEGGGGGGA